MKERVIRYTKMTVRLALRGVSVIAAICCFVLFFGILAAMGASGRARHGDFQKTVEFIKNLTELIEGVIATGILIAICAIIYICGFIVLIINAIIEKLKSLVTYPMKYIYGKRGIVFKKNSVQNDGKRFECIQTDKDSSSIINTFLEVTVSGVIDWLGSIGKESEEEETSLAYIENKVKEKCKIIWNAATLHVDSFLDKCETKKDIEDEVEKETTEEIHIVPALSSLKKEKEAKVKETKKVE